MKFNFHKSQICECHKKDENMITMGELDDEKYKYKWSTAAKRSTNQTTKSMVTEDSTKGNTREGRARYVSNLFGKPHGL